MRRAEMASQLIVFCTKRQKRKRIQDSESEAAAAAAEFARVAHDDLLLEIFVRLPHARYVFRCAAACKRWRSLLSDPNFIRRYIHYHQSQSRSVPFTLVVQIGYYFRVFNEESKSIHSSTVTKGTRRYRYLHFLPPPMCAALDASQEGLLLCHDSDSCPVVSDPLTRRWARLPEPPMSNRTIMVTGFACDHRCLTVVRFNIHSVLGSTHWAFPMYMFRSETGRWDPHTMAAPRESAPAFLTLWNAVLTTGNGVMHVQHAKLERRLAGIMAFRPSDNEEPKQGWFVGLPPGFDSTGPRDQQDKFCWGLIRGRLRLAQCFATDSSFALKVWELKYSHDNAASWVVVYDGELKSFEEITEHTSVKAIHPNNGSVVLVMNNNGIVFEYDFEVKEYSKLGHIPYESLKHYTGSLHGGMLTLTLLHPSWPIPIHQLIAA